MVFLTYLLSNIFFTVEYAVGKDCIMHGHLLKLGGPFMTTWQRRYFYLFPNRLEFMGDGEKGVSFDSVVEEVVVEICKYANWARY